jgi:hypothetical protein
MLDNALNAEDHQSGMYIHALAKINKFKKFCNLGSSAPTIKADIGSKLHGPRALAWNSTTAQEAFENLASLGQASCMLCCIDLDTPSQDGLSLADDSPRAQLTRRLRLICDTCFQQTMEGQSVPICICEGRESCLVMTVSTNRVTSSPGTPTPERAMEHYGPTTKINALSAELQSTHSEKRCDT